MAIYETIPTKALSKENELDSTSDLPELVHFHDSAKSVYFDFSKSSPPTISPRTSLDVAIHDLKILNIPLLLIEERGQIIGLVTQEDLLGEKPLRLMQEQLLDREEITVAMLMKPPSRILVIDAVNLKHAKVGHIVKTLKENAVSYILVVRKARGEKHLIKGLFSASQISRQLHIDITSTLTKAPETILELHKERKV